MTYRPVYPTSQHARAAEAASAFFAARPEVESVLLTGSCARGRATPDSCLDITVLLSAEAGPGAAELLEQDWQAYSSGQPFDRELRQAGAFSFVDLNIHTGQFSIPYHGWMSGPDEFELEIGNLLVYSVLLWDREGAFERLKARWLPYYAEPLRQERLAMVRKYGLNNLAHIPLYIPRGLYFQSFDRLYHAFGEFLQGLFLARRVYPIAYNKWIREQIVEILGLPELYPRLTGLFEIEHFESEAILAKAADLKDLYDKYLHK